MGLLYSTKLYLWTQKTNYEDRCGCIEQIKGPGCCYCFDTIIPGGYELDQRIKIPHGEKDLPHEIVCLALKSPDLGDIFVWDDRIRVVRQVVDHSGQLGNLFSLDTRVLPLPDPAHGILVKLLSGEDA